MIKKLIADYLDWCKREYFNSIMSQYKLTEQEIINISCICMVHSVPKYLINRLIKCRFGWYYIDANEMMVLITRCENERLLRYGVEIDGEITHESIVSFFEIKYQHALEMNGFGKNLK